MARTAITADASALLGIAFEWGLYGFSVLMFGATIHFLKLRTRDTPSKAMIGVACTLFALSTAHCVLDLVRIFQGFIDEQTRVPGGAAVFFSDVATDVFAAKSALYHLQTLVGDGMLIYRCYIVWGKKWSVLILPALLWTSFAVCGCVLVYLFSTAAHGGKTDIFLFKQWITAYLSCGIAANLVSTGLLAFRIWYVDRKTAIFHAHRPAPLGDVVRIVLDSGALYSVALTIALVTFLCHSNAQYVVIDMIVPIIAIAFYLVIIRVTLRGKKNIKDVDSTALNSSRDGRSVHARDQYPLRPVQVHISQLAETDRDKQDRGELQTGVSNMQDKRGAEYIRQQSNHWDSL